jgi:hypothetical protein
VSFPNTLRNRRASWLLGMCVALCADIGTASAQEKSPEFSQAEVLLWMTDQLSAVTAPVTLMYAFKRSGALEAGFDDQIEFQIRKVHEDGTKSAAVRFFTGERNFPVPPVENTTVNPILKIYLQGDVLEMNRLSDPNGTARERWRYFQRRIKFALAESATVQAHTFEFDGRRWNGHKIEFQPYVNDPRRNLFEKYADKSYSFIVSDELPGYVYQIETVVPGAKEGAPLIREFLQLDSIAR